MEKWDLGLKRGCKEEQDLGRIKTREESIWPAFDNSQILLIVCLDTEFQFAQHAHFLKLQAYYDRYCRQWLRDAACI